MGMTYSALFVAIQASVKPGQVSAALSTLSLCSAIGVISGVASTGAIVKFVLENSLETKLYRLGLDAVKRQAVRVCIGLRKFSSMLMNITGCL